MRMDGGHVKAPNRDQQEIGTLMAWRRARHGHSCCRDDWRGEPAWGKCLPLQEGTTTFGFSDGFFGSILQSAFAPQPCDRFTGFALGLGGLAASTIFQR